MLATFSLTLAFTHVRRFILVLVQRERERERSSRAMRRFEGGFPSFKFIQVVLCFDCTNQSINDDC